MPYLMVSFSEIENLNSYFERIKSPKIDIPALMKLSEKDTVTLLRSCTDLEGKKAYLSVSAVQVKADKNKVWKVLLEPEKLQGAIPSLKKVKVLRKLSEDIYEIEFEVEINIISVIRPTVRYIAVSRIEDQKIISFVKEGENKGSWRIWQVYESEKDKTLLILVMCEYVRNIPIAEKIFSSNPYIELGVVSSSSLIPVISLKKFIEENHKESSER
jgi:carbon monoxide dehydrogenase subunit G